jgi:hypothetical protein
MAMNHLMDKHDKKNKKMGCLWWRHTWWNPKMDGIMFLITKSKKQHILGNWCDGYKH